MRLTDKSRFDTGKLVIICFVIGLCQLQAIASTDRNDDSADILFSIKTKIIHKINPRIFGQFMERPSWGEIGVEGGVIPGTNKLQPSVLRLLEEMEIPVIRFPEIGRASCRERV